MIEVAEQRKNSNICEGRKDICYNTVVAKCERATVGTDYNGDCLELGHTLKYNETLVWLHDDFCINNQRTIIKGSRKILKGDNYKCSSSIQHLF